MSERAASPDMYAALSCMRHRGPDAHGVARARSAHLGHTLLSIIGTEPVLQPKRDSASQAALTYNGEVYNYRELREEDSGISRVTSGSSDTEVLFAGLQLYGIRFVEKVNGMFAFAYVDDRGDVYLVRDRLGIKPLLYEVGAQGVAFASEQEALARLTARHRDPDPFGWYSYARARYPIDGATFDAGVQMLPPGHYLRVRGRQVTLHQYWRIDVVPDCRVSEASMLADTEALLADSVRLRMRSDHSFCTFLSGGLDSSLLTALAADTKPDLETYSVAVDQAGFDESSFARLVSKELDTQHTELRLDKSQFSAQTTRMWDELRVPLGVPNVVAIGALAELMSERHRCVLSGEGADEIFGGYGRIFLLSHDWAAANESDPQRGTRGRFRDIYGGTEFPDLESLFISRYSYLDHSETQAVLGRVFSPSELAGCRERYEEAIRREFAHASNNHSGDQILMVFQRLHLPGLLLRLDAATMFHSVEARVPFLDHRLVEYANSLPIEFKMRRKSSWGDAVSRGALSEDLSEVHDMPKWPLRAIAKGWIPDEITDRRKLGFPIPPQFYGADTHDAMAGYSAWVKANVAGLWRRMT